MESKPQKLYNTVEGKILWIGIFLTILLIFIIGYYLILDPSKAKVLTLVFVAHAFGGRAAAVGLCIVNDMHFFPTLMYNFFLEIQLVFIIYSIFILSITNYIKSQWIHRIANQMRHNADKNKDKIKKYGFIGIFFFVMAPLPATGPVSGVILGYLLKMNVYKNFTAAFSGTFCAVLMWVVCFDFLQHYLYIIQYILVVIIVFFVFSNLKTIKSWFTKQEGDKIN
ncbi:MAG: small multi-drug export protein [Desulfamplus sp.]|nr:small multi-drug export protein [Desulfamplus sp.]